MEINTDFNCYDATDIATTAVLSYLPVTELSELKFSNEEIFNELFSIVIIVNLAHELVVHSPRSIRSMVSKVVNIVLGIFRLLSAVFLGTTLSSIISAELKDKPIQMLILSLPIFFIVNRTFALVQYKFNKYYPVNNAKI